MKKLLLLLLPASLILSCVDNNQNLNDLEYKNLKGKVKSFETKTYLAKTSFGELEREHLIEKIISEFNTEGNFTEQSKYSTKTNNLKDEFLLDFKWIYKYNEDGKFSERNTFNADGEITEKIILKYNTDGNRTEESTFDAEGKLERKIKHQYNEDGIKTELFC